VQGADVVWNDESGHNRAVATAGRPMLAAGAFPKGSLPVVRFDGNDYFTLADSAALRLKEFSVYAVVNVKAGAENQTYYSNCDPLNYGKGAVLQITPARHIYFFTSDGTRENYDPVSSKEAVSEGWHIITATYDGTAKNIYADGVNIGSFPAKAIDYGNYTVAAIGAMREYEAWFRSDIAEIIVYDKVDADQRAAVETYLSDKYGIAVRSESGSKDMGNPALWLKADDGIAKVTNDIAFAGFDGKAGLTFVKESKRKTTEGGSEVCSEWARSEKLKLDWFVRSFPEVSVVEFQARLRNEGAAPVSQLREFGPLSLHLRGDAGKLKVHWTRRDGYAKREDDLKDTFVISGGSWNAPKSAGWLAIENTDAQEVLFLGIEWESYWRIGLRRQGSEVLLDCTLENFARDIAPGKEMISPRVFLGVSHGDIDDSLRDLHDYLRKYVMPPKLPNWPWVTYNIWGTAGDGSDEKAILQEIPFAADLGIDLFYIDASWYEGSCKNGSGDWFTGLGNWHSEDFQKYPHGLANISKRVHDAGMKFGLWFAPQMVDSRLVGGRIPDSWVAKHDGKPLVSDLGNGWSPITQICLGNPEVVQFLKKSIGSAVQRYGLDWIKWDNSGLPGGVCNRSDHGHQAGDGAIAELEGEYEVWKYLHTQFPNLVMEQCGWPSRVDYGLARYMRTNWLSDASDNALHVRRNIISCSYIYPTAVIEAWVYKGSETDKEKDPDILDTIMRSRMIGHPGFGMLINDPNGVERVSLYPAEAIAAAKRNIANYKKYRHLLMEDVYHILPPASSPDQWDAIQFCRRDGMEAMVAAFRGGSTESERVFKLRGLKPDASYTLTSLNTGGSRRAPGARLLSEGLRVFLPKPGMSEIYLIKCSGGR